MFTKILKFLGISKQNSSIDLKFGLTWKTLNPQSLQDVRRGN